MPAGTVDMRALDGRRAGGQVRKPRRRTGATRYQILPEAPTAASGSHLLVSSCPRPALGVIKRRG